MADAYYVNEDVAIFVIAVAAGVELVYLLLCHVLLSPSIDELDLKRDLLQAQREKKKIKSVQLQLVESSKLERRINNAEKKLEKLCEAQVPRVTLVSNILNMVKWSGYIIFLLQYSHSRESILLLNSNLFWFTPFYQGGNVIIDIGGWQLLLAATLCFRHIYRAIQPVLLPDLVVP